MLCLDFIIKYLYWIIQFSSLFAEKAFVLIISLIFHSWNVYLFVFCWEKNVCTIPESKNQLKLISRNRDMKDFVEGSILTMELGSDSVLILWSMCRINRLIFILWETKKPNESFYLKIKVKKKAKRVFVSSLR